MEGEAIKELGLITVKNLWKKHTEIFFRTQREHGEIFFNLTIVVYCVCKPCIYNQTQSQLHSCIQLIKWKETERNHACVEIFSLRVCLGILFLTLSLYWTKFSPEGNQHLVEYRLQQGGRTTFESLVQGHEKKSSSRCRRCTCVSPHEF